MDDMGPAGARELLGILTSSNNVFKADVESRVGVRGERVSILADDVLGLAVLVADCVFDLEDCKLGC